MEMDGTLEVSTKKKKPSKKIQNLVMSNRLFWTNFSNPPKRRCLGCSNQTKKNPLKKRRTWCQIGFFGQPFPLHQKEGIPRTRHPKKKEPSQKRQNLVSNRLFWTNFSPPFEKRCRGQPTKGKKALFKPYTCRFGQFWTLHPTLQHLGSVIQTKKSPL